MESNVHTKKDITFLFHYKISVTREGAILSLQDRISYANTFYVLLGKELKYKYLLY